MRCYSSLANPCIQVESALAVQKLKPTIDAIKRQYGDDKNSIQRETSALYEASGVNPAAGELHSAVLHSLQDGYKETHACQDSSLKQPGNFHNHMLEECQGFCCAASR